MKQNYRFLLGGHDLEMLTLRGLLQAQGVDYRDLGLGWGARASSYAADISAALAAGVEPVAVELQDDLAAEVSARVRWIDHHGDRAGAGRPSSLRQAFDLLGLPEAAWTRQFMLVAANDIGHIRGMREMGATDAEMRGIREAEFAALGITVEIIEQTRLAYTLREAPAPGLIWVRLPHDRTSLVGDLADPLFGGAGETEILVAALAEWSYFGCGTCVQAYARRYGGWWGGALPERGYWGTSLGDVPNEALDDLVEIWRNCAAC